MADFIKLKSPLVNSKVQVENNALFQTINGLIDTSKKVTDDTNTTVEALQQTVDSFNNITILDIDTRTAPQSVTLANIIGLTIVKDTYGNAAVNNITLVGSVEGVVNPVVNANYGIYRVFISLADGLFHKW